MIRRKSINAPPTDAPAGTVWVGGPIDEWCISLLIFDDKLEPDYITSRLGVTPTCCHRKGDEILSTNGKRSRVARTGSWSIDCDLPEQEPIDIETDICSFLDSLPADLGIWSEIASSSEIKLSCDVFLNAPSRGMVLTTGMLRKLADRHIEFWLDMFSPDERFGVAR